MRLASRVNIHAKSGRGVDKRSQHLRAALASWETRIPTAELNTYVRQLVQETPPPARGGRAPKIKYVTQAATDPPTFVFFVNDPELVHFTYQRFLENRLREAFGFAGTALRLVFRGGRDEKKEAAAPRRLRA